MLLRFWHPAIRRGRPCRLITHPQWLARRAGLEVCTAEYGHEPPFGDAATQSARLYGEAARARRTYEEVIVPADLHVDSVESISADQELTERAMTQKSLQDLDARQQRMMQAIERVVTQVNSLSEQIARSSMARGSRSLSQAAQNSGGRSEERLI